VLDDVRGRGTLRCGVNDAVPGFGFVTAGGEFQGFDIDYCRAVAAGVLGDADAVEFMPLTAEQRFTALQTREIDVLIRNTTWTSSRDGSEGATFLTTTFYDGQGMMVRADSRYQDLEDMAGTTICVLSGTTTELNLEAQFRARGIRHTPLSFEQNDTLQQAFIQRRCDGWTSDKSQLAGIRSNWPENQGGPDGLRILDETMSKEPLGPVVRDGDSRWADAVNWIVIATIQAEEFGVTSENVEQMRTSDDPEVRRFLGQPVEGEPFDAGLGLDPDFAVNVVSAVGNYGQIYQRNVGPETALGLERGMNALWTQGGLLYAPPYR
jgi:general L-amino acid transport system substrate-binding protein